MSKKYLYLPLLTLLLFAVSCTSTPLSHPEDFSQAEASDQILTITGFDGVQFDGRLRLPSGPVETLVIYVNGSGPNTYDNHRKMGKSLEFSYFDLFAQQCNQRNLGFFSYDTRGVTLGQTPPLYQTIDKEQYKTYLPSNEIKDIESIIETLHTVPRLSKTRIILLGWSSGTAIAPRVALEKPSFVDALVLAGYMNTTMEETLAWQQSGEASMIFYRQYFDDNKDLSISPEELNKDQYGILPALGMNKETAFAQLDANADGVIDVEDFKLMLAPGFAQLKKAIKEGDDQWLQANYGVFLTSGWFKDYAMNMPANSEILSKLTLPIHIFHGTLDRNVPVQGVRDIEKTFNQMGKKNLTIHIFAGHDHDLNYLLYPQTGKIPEGLEQLFDTLATL
ncbi:alpha/beta fold hydrolase [uncultured Sphaerochaeta sp.]|uniref:alpha/beta fold hydrolase n=1 Tax=uncultured Sphaerochaeta sp. TaxID=886478 RepID=UPI002A0A63A4|nr:alpha/beta fold hydrolase [uncultured Sphaerochaeta sp.]